jgi:hypothetical protein
MTTVFPLRDAYPFAEQKGLLTEIQQIRLMQPSFRHHPSSVRRAAVIRSGNAPLGFDRPPGVSLPV